METLKKLDHIGSEFKFNIKGGKYKTTFGGIITIFLAIISLVSCWYFGQDLYLRQSPKYFAKQTHLNSYPVKFLNSSEMFFALAIKDENNDPIEDKSYFVHNFNYIQWIKDNETKKMVKYKTTEQMEKCSTKHIDEYHLNKYELSTYFCHSFSNLKVGGDYHADAQYIIEYSIDRCNYDISQAYNVTCKEHDDVLDMYRDYSHIDIIMKKTLVDPNNFTYPLQDDYVYKYENYDLNSLKETKIYISNASIQTDANWVFDNVYEEIFNQFETSEAYGGHIGDKELNAAKYYFHFSKNLDTHYRSYIKIPDVLAVVGGLMSIIQSVIAGIYSIYLDLHLKIFLFTNLYKFTDDEIVHGENLEDMERAVKIDIKEIRDSKEMKGSKDSKEDKYIKEDKDGKGNEILELSLKKDKDIELSESKIINDESNLGIKEINEYNHNLHDNNHSPPLTKTPSLTGNIPNKRMQSPKKQNIVIKKTSFKPIKLNNPSENDTNIKKYMELKLTKKNYPEVFICEYFKFTYLPCRLANKAKLFRSFEIIEYELEKKTDIIHLLRKLDKLNIFKKAIFNNDQSFMLENARLKPIDVEKAIEVKFEDLQYKRKVDKISEMITYIYKKNEENSLNELDKVLINNLEKELRNIL